MCDSQLYHGCRNFCQVGERGWGGGSRSIWHIKKKGSDNGFFYHFFSPQFILQKSSGYFQRKLLFAKIPVGVEHFPGGRGVQLFTGGSNFRYIPIETHITCDFPGDPDRPPPPPLDPPM